MPGLTFLVHHLLFLQKKKKKKKNHSAYRNSDWSIKHVLILSTMLVLPFFCANDFRKSYM